MEYLTNFLKNHPGTGLIAPKLINKYGKTHSSCRHFPTISDLRLELSGLPKLLPKKIKSKWKMVDVYHNTLMEVEQPEASCLMTHRKALHQTGLMDERFPIFFNDVD